MEKRKRPSGLAGFLVMLLGQLFSLTGTGMSRFAFTLWAWELTGQATAVALIGIFFFVPVLLMSPVAGALVDRYDRKKMMALSDIASGCASLFLLVMALSQHLALWHLYLAAAFIGTFETFQWPAWSAATSVMLEKKHYGRASALHGLVMSSANIMAPIFAAALYGSIGLSGLLVLDLSSLVVALFTLYLVTVPNPPASDLGSKERSLWQDSLFGFRYIWTRRNLLYVQIVFLFGNMLFSVLGSLQAPMILARTGNDSGVLATVNAVSSVGGILAGALIGVWGGFQRKIWGVLLGWGMAFLFGMVAFGLTTEPALWALFGFLTMMSFPLVDASNQGLWMSKVPPDLQGRVFSARRLIAQVAGPVASMIAAPLADLLFEPQMQMGGAFVPVFGSFIPAGAGAGMQTLIFLAGVLGLGMVIIAFNVRAVRHVERLIPDHDQVNLMPQPVGD